MAAAAARAIFSNSGSNTALLQTLRSRILAGSGAFNVETFLASGHKLPEVSTIFSPYTIGNQPNGSVFGGAAESIIKGDALNRRFSGFQEMSRLEARGRKAVSEDDEDDEEVDGEEHYGEDLEYFHKDLEKDDDDDEDDDNDFDEDDDPKIKKRK